MKQGCKLQTKANFFHWPEPRVVRSYLTLNITPELIKHKLLLLTRFTAKLFLKSCPLNAANTMLGICYTCVVLCCSAHRCCTIECDISCCAAQSTAIATLTLPHTRLVAHQSIQQLQTKHTNQLPNPWGPGRTTGHAQRITYRTYWGPS